MTYLALPMARLGNEQGRGRCRFCGCCRTISAPRGSTAAETCSAWWADDGNDFFFAWRGRASADDVIHKRTATGMMEDFCEAGLEACAFASGEDEDSNVVIGHGQSIVHWTRGF